MRRSITLLIPVFMLATAVAQEQSPTNVQQVRRQFLPYGLQGRVHTLLMKTEELAKDPRPPFRPIEGSQNKLPPLQTMAMSPSWLSFDENGRLVEQGTVSPDGKFASLTQHEGNTAVTTVKLPNQTVQSTELRSTNNGHNVETEVYRNGQLTQKWESKTDDSRKGEHRFEHQTYDVHGKLLNESSIETTTDISPGNAAGQDRTITRTTQQVINGRNEDRKVVDRSSADHQQTEHSEYDTNGNLICTLRVSGTTPVEAAIVPDAKFPCRAGAAAVKEGKRYMFTLYPNGAQGELITEVFIFPANDLHRIGIDPDSVERLDRNGNLLDKVSFHYDRDAQGNWITRVISVLDPASNQMVEIERDTRTITYYDEP